MVRKLDGGEERDNQRKPESRVGFFPSRPATGLGDASFGLAVLGILPNVLARSWGHIEGNNPKQRRIPCVH